MKSAASWMRRSSCSRVAGLTQSMRAAFWRSARSSAQASRTRAIRCRRSSGSGRAAARPSAIASRRRPAGPSRGRRLSAKASSRASRRTAPGRVLRAGRVGRSAVPSGRRAGSPAPPARRRARRRPPASGCVDRDRAGPSRSRGRRAPASCPRRGGPGDCARPGSPCLAAPRGTPAPAPPVRAEPSSGSGSNAYTSFAANFLRGLGDGPRQAQELAIGVAQLLVEQGGHFLLRLLPQRQRRAENLAAVFGERRQAPPPVGRRPRATPSPASRGRAGCGSGWFHPWRSDSPGP